jgi:oligopeptide/dipeptide ABC transporter ATP-binding protein
MSLLEVETLKKLYPVRDGRLWGTARRLHALDGVSFVVESGEAVGLVGESGCGKSTLAALVARLVDPSSGAIRFEGVDIAAVPARRAARAPWRADLQMAFQDPFDSLDPRRTISHAIAAPLLRLKGLTGVALEARLAMALERVQLGSDLLDRRPHELSGGQLARAGLARALALEPKLLILDEPTSALDVSLQAAILKRLHALRRELGLAMLFVSHDLNVVRMVCQRALVMHLGRLVEEGPADALFERPAHPYTAALAAAAPRLGQAARPRADRVAAEPPSAIDLPAASCAYASLCPRAQARCRVERPERTIIGEGRAVACFHPLR